MKIGKLSHVWMWVLLVGCGGRVELSEPPPVPTVEDVPPVPPVPPVEDAGVPDAPPDAPAGPCCVFYDGTGQACGCDVPTLFYAPGDVPFWCTSTPRACAPASSCSAIVDGHAHLGWCR